MTTSARSVTKESNPLELTSSPHLHSRWSIKNVMWLVVLALLPCILAAVIFFGYRQLAVMGATIAAANAAEAATLALRKRKITLHDGSATVTGLLLALTLPPDFPLVLACIGAVVAIGLGKQVFGGLGHNIFNPALVGRAFLAASFPGPMTTWILPSYTIDSITTATPLAAIKFEAILAPISHTFMGNIGGTLGETSDLAILTGGILLVALGIANWRIPLSMILGLAALSTVGWLIRPAANPSPLFQLFTGGFMFSAFFMATDWATSPISSRGKWFFGFGIALMVMIIRSFAGSAEGVMFAVLLMNAFVPLINRYTIPRPFGVNL